MTPRTTLDQWRALAAVVDEGGYARAAEALNKSQSSVTYAVQRLEELLGVDVLAVEGRRARLTEAGQVLYRRAKAMLDEAASLEDLGRALAGGWEPEVRLAVNVILPVGVALRAIDDLAREVPTTRVQLHEHVLSGSDDMLLARSVDLAVSAFLPPGFLGDHFMRVRFIAVAHPDHPLHHLGREVTYQDLRAHRQLVVRDSGSRPRDAGWLGAEQRLTVSHMTTSIQAVAEGIGFAWLPEEKIQRELAEGSLARLPLREGAIRYADLFLVYASPDHAGPATRRLAELLRVRARADCPRAATGAGDGDS